jgi:uncharacterized protein (TIGR00162 family)
MAAGTWIKMRDGVKFNKPILIVGLPGVGNVGKIVVTHIKTELRAKRFATLYSNHFLHRVIMMKNGKLRMMSNRFYYVKAKKKGGKDIVLLTGDDQAVTPEGQYEVNLAIVDFFKNELGGSFVFTVGGYAPAEPIASTPQVFGNASDKEVIKTFKGAKVVFGKTKGVIWGSAGLIVALAKQRGIPGICLMGETAIMDMDAAAAKSVLSLLGNVLNLQLNTQGLDDIINKTTKALKELEQQMSMGIFQQPQNIQNPSTPEQGPSYIR